MPSPAVTHAALPLLLALAGCGGNGSANLSPAHLNSAPGDAAIEAYLKTAQNPPALTATDTMGNSFVIQTSLTPNPGTSTFNGVAGLLSSAATVSLSKNGTLFGTSSSTNYYTLTPYTPYGSQGSGGTPYIVASNPTPLPTTVNVGDSGPIDQLTYYHDSTKSVVDATGSDTYTASVNDAKTLLLCLNTATTGTTGQGTADGVSNGTESDCYAVDSAGNATLVSISVTVAGETLVFK